MSTDEKTSETPRVRMLKFKSAENKAIVEGPLDAMTSMSKTLANLLEDTPGDMCDMGIPLRAVPDDASLQRVVDYCVYHTKNPDKFCDSLERSDDICEWDRRLCGDLSTRDLFNLIIASNYLDCEPLIALATKVVANNIKNMGSHEIKARFGIRTVNTADMPNDPEE